jgi:hypothetical protein
MEWERQLAEANATIKKLRKALTSLTESCWSNKRGGGVEIHAPTDIELTKAIELLDEISEE